MVNYRRTKISGATYFFTVTIKNRNTGYLVKNINHLREAFQKTKILKPFKTITFVILPDHIHTIWRLPAGDFDYSSRWQYIKKYFTHSLEVKEPIWQNRFWEHTIKNQKDLETHINYIHYNPVKHAYVKAAQAWPYSSIHHYIHLKKPSENWGAELKEETLDKQVFGG